MAPWLLYAQLYMHRNAQKNADADWQYYRCCMVQLRTGGWGVQGHSSIGGGAAPTEIVADRRALIVGISLFYVVVKIVRNEVVLTHAATAADRRPCHVICCTVRRTINKNNITTMPRDIFSGMHKLRITYVY